MTKMLKGAALATALAVSPFAASAATMLADGDTNTIGTGEVFQFQLSSTNGDAGDSLSFTFNNASATDTTVAVTLATVAQLLATYTNGVQFAWSTGGDASFAAGESGAAEFTTTIAAGGSADLSLDFGDVVGTGIGGVNGSADVDFFVAAVPLPAGGLLLLSAFGAVAVARRKKA